MTKSPSRSFIVLGSLPLFRQLLEKKVLLYYYATESNTVNSNVKAFVQFSKRLSQLQVKKQGFVCIERITSRRIDVLDALRDIPKPAVSCGILSYQGVYNPYIADDALRRQRARNCSVTMTNGYRRRLELPLEFNHDVTKDDPLNLQSMDDCTLNSNQVNDDNS